MLTSALVLASATAAQATTTAPNFRLAPLPTSFTAPIWVGGAGVGTSTRYVAEQGGTIWKLAAGRRTKLLDLRASIATGGEQGLLSVGFAHDFRTSGRMYTWSVARTGAGQLRQYRIRNGSVVAGSGRLVITVPLSPPAATNHNGGTVWPMPDGTVLLSVGDGGGGGDPAGNAQRLDRLTGKLLRITPKANGGYTIPRANPFIARPGARKEVWALGLRNPWRFSVDGPTGNIWIGDVGQDSREEVDLLRGGGPAGANFGWARFEGNEVHDASRVLTSGTRYVRPRITYGRTNGACSVTGGVVYRGPVRALRGWYLYGDFCTSSVTAFRDVGSRSAQRPGVGGIVHFGSGVPSGDVYAASVNTGRIYKVVAR